MTVEQADFEARWYAKRIVDVLNKCEFDAHLNPVIGWGDPNASIPLGLGFLANGTEPPPFAIFLLNAFKTIGIIPQVASLQENVPADGILEIRVWHKPEK